MIELISDTSWASGQSGAGAGADPAGQALAAIVAAAFGLGVEEIRSRRRGQADIAFARQVAMYLAHTRLGLPFATTGRLFHRDRTTARHACCLVEDRREDPRVDSLIDCLERALDISVDMAQFRRSGRHNAG